MHGEVEGFGGKTQVLGATSSKLEIKWADPGRVLPTSRVQFKVVPLLETERQRDERTGWLVEVPVQQRAPRFPPVYSDFLHHTMFHSLFFPVLHSSHTLNALSDAMGLVAAYKVEEDLQRVWREEQAQSKQSQW